MYTSMYMYPYLYVHLLVLIHENKWNTIDYQPKILRPWWQYAETVTALPISDLAVGVPGELGIVVLVDAEVASAQAANSRSGGSYPSYPPEV